jgi:hypothetical protein
MPHFQAKNKIFAHTDIKTDRYHSWVLENKLKLETGVRIFKAAPRIQNGFGFTDLENSNFDDT